MSESMDFILISPHWSEGEGDAMHKYVEQQIQIYLIGLFYIGPKLTLALTMPPAKK